MLIRYGSITPSSSRTGVRGRERIGPGSIPAHWLPPARPLRRLTAPGCGLRAAGSGLRAAGSGLRAAGSGLRAAGSGLRAAGSGLRAA
ncbi:hypothetical protein, partial [Micromonospora musae]|uniref:hypothetical protein n=1 Tax=Micromonospora musae TaxID=1894970 RepID=UPI00342E14E5